MAATCAPVAMAAMVSDICRLPSLQQSDQLHRPPDDSVRSFCRAEAVGRVDEGAARLSGAALIRDRVPHIDRALQPRKQGMYPCWQLETRNSGKHSESAASISRTPG